MDILDFNSFKEKVLNVYIKELKELDGVGCLTINQKAIDKIYIYYQRLRNTVRTLYMKNNSGDLSLDRHKVGSCIMYGILCSKIIHVNKSIPDLPPYLLMANQYLAVNVAINVVEMYRLTDGKENYKIKLPVSYHKNDNLTFLYEFCTTLYHLKPKKHFDVFAYATILFQLEHLTDYVLSDEVNREKLIETI